MRIRASYASPVVQGSGALALIGLSLVASGVVPAQAIGGCVFAFACAVIARHVRIAGAWLDADGVEVRGVFLHERIEWSELRVIRTDHIVDKWSAGDVIRYLDAREQPRSSSWWGVLLTEAATFAFADFLMGHGIPVLVDPPDDPRVRFEEWRADPFDHDPFESIATVRRAVIGDRVVSVRPRGDVFVAVTMDERTGEQIAISDDQPDLAHAVQQAYVQIRTEQQRRREAG
ncbi:MAG: hypothetical protein U0Q03_12240 [Acidimicrobiales bacterium]